MPPDGLDLAAFFDQLGQQYPLAGDPPRFQPLGEDSWSFTVSGLWVSLRRDLRGHVPGAYAAAAELRDAGMTAVLAPIAGQDGRVVRSIEGYPVVVYDYLPCDTLVGVALTDAGRHRVVDAISAVHAADVLADLPCESYELSFDADLARAIRAGDRAAAAGPYGARLALLLRHHRRRLDGERREIARLGAMCRAIGGAPGLTHGEPSAANILRPHGSDSLLLADWGGAMWGPPERDWFHIYRTLGIDFAFRPHLYRFYELRWRLSEIAEYATRFSQPHIGDVEDDAMWSRLLRYLPERTNGEDCQK